jgi:hypothetical protein
VVVGVAAVTLAEKLLALASALTSAQVPHAYGGAIALAYALEEPRATRDLDLNVFLDTRAAPDVLTAIESLVGHDEADLATLRRDDQVRLWWDETPVDLFFAAAPFHLEVAQRCRTVPFGGQEIRVLAPDDLATFKVLFDRTKDWLDLRLMWESGTLDVAVVSRRLTDLVGDDPRIGRLQAIPRD